MRAPSSLAKARLTEGPVAPTLWHLSWPMTMGLFSVIAFNIVDTFYIGMLGADQLAAMGFCFPVIFAMGAIAMGLGNGGLSVVSRAIGAGLAGRARRLTTNTVVLNTIISLSLTGLMYLAHDGIFALLRAPDHIKPYIDQYMYVWYAGLWFLITPIACNTLIRANGDSLAPSIMMVVAAAINAVLSPIFIFGLLGVPEMGMPGAAWATIVARGLIAVVALWYLGFKTAMMEVSVKAVKALPRHVGSIMRYAIPAAMTQMVSPLSTALIVIMLAEYGPNAVAGVTVGTRIESFLMIPFFAFQTGISPFVGQNIGARKPERLGFAEGWIWKFAVFWGLISFVILAMFGQDIAALFSDDPEIIAITDQYLFIVGTGFVFAGVFHVAGGVFNPLGHPNLGAAVSAFRYIVLYAGLAFAFSNGVPFEGLGGVTGICVAAALAWVIAGLFSGALVNRLLPRREEDCHPAHTALPPQRETITAGPSK